MPEAPVLASHARGGRIVPTRLVLRAEGGEASAAWSSHELAGFSLELEAVSRGASGELRVAVQNAGSAPRRLDALSIGFEWFAPGSEPTRVRSLETAALAGHAEGGASALIGALATRGALARATAEATPHGAGLEIELGVGAVLEPGEPRVLGAVALATGDDPNALLEDFGARWGRAGEARVWRPAPLVWAPDGAPGGAALERWLEALAARRARPPAEALLLSAECAGGVGDWSELAEHLGAAADAIRAAGLVPGLRVAPLLAAPDSEVCRRNPDWFSEAGRSDGRLRLDPTRDGALAHLERGLRSLHERGFFFFQLEGLDADLGAAVVSDASRGPAERLHELLRAVRRGASDEAFLLAADGPPGPAIGAVDAAFVGDAAGAVGNVWMHRRLWLCASAAPEAAETGAMLVARGALGDPAAPDSETLARWSDAARRAQRADEGLPGAARAAEPLGPAPLRLAAPQQPSTPPPLAVFCDFDGTFSVQDVGATLARHHGGERRAEQWARYERGEITPWEYNREILDGLPVDTEALEEFLRSVDLDPGARHLLDWCDARRVPFRILSDGFDWNLNRLQALHGVRFAYTANHLRVEHGRWRIAPGAPDARCGCGTGTCKAGVLRAYRARHPGAHLVHIGNGRVSDSCGAIEADTAFAKDSLAESLARRGEPFLAFETLSDALPHLEGILSASGPEARRDRPAPAF